MVFICTGLTFPAGKPLEWWLMLLLGVFTGGDKEIDVIDVCRQADLKMRLGDFVEYYNSPNRDKVLNVISLEFSETKYVHIYVLQTKSLILFNNLILVYWLHSCL